MPRGQLSQTGCPDRACAQQALIQALQRVRQQEKRAPPFILRDMHSLMCTMCGLLLCTAGNDDVTKSDRCEWHAGYCFAQYPTARRKADFQHTANAPDLCPNDSGQQGSANAHGGGWRGPDVFEDGGRDIVGFVQFGVGIQHEPKTSYLRVQTRQESLEVHPSVRRSCLDRQSERCRFRPSLYL